MCAVRINKPSPDPRTASPAELPRTKHFGALPMPPPSDFPPPLTQEGITTTPLTSGDFHPRSRHRTILDSLYEAVFVTDYNGIVSEVNTRAEKMTHTPQFDMLNRHISAVIPMLTEEFLAGTLEHLATVNHATMEGWCRQSDGNRLRVGIAISRIHSPNRTELVFTLRNNTRQYATRLQHLSERLMLQHVACGIALVDIESCIQYVNTAFAQTWRREDMDEIVGMRVDEIWPADVAAQLLDPLTSGSPWSGEMTLTIPNGPVRTFQANSVPYHDRNGDVEGVVVSFIDTTALKTAEATIRREAELQMEAVRHEGNFAGSLNILAIPDLIQLIVSSNKTGTLEIMSGPDQETAFASFDNGRMVCACCNGVTGEPAVEKMVEQGGRLFRFRQDVIRDRDASITRGTMALLFDALRILDEKKEAEKQ